ncbi:low specificity L-threonine aldolase [Dysgonomonas sp. 511]|uniref:threonine aldolase family protein n=1 Tax=Dysgonomonas sp. 511 TaxID=2302930 RepID=UPI0013D7D1A8|nr:aminotransferase class I/II-fold pyridoxal phosphate-dependent enzyme [Dysgonomonas sp. 511]NDV79773.1 aminotransferase class V-fold PLP-dependent enzyme [Dysgonomonas sp. 511]
MKYSFANDYAEGCHPSILEELVVSNFDQQQGYGCDSHTQSAVAAIRMRIHDPSAAVHFVSGGTQANLVVLSSMLRPFESVAAATTGHIYTNESGAIEATGHKVEAVPTAGGKLCPDDIKPLLNKARGHHAVRTRAVYISNATELGTIYTYKELSDLYIFCKENDLLLFMDGARLPMALAAGGGDMSLTDIAALTDVFYLGGTKCGALLGEAIVITNEELKKDFEYHLKQRGALMAKGRTIGVQFDCLLRNDLIFRLAAHANKMAGKLSEAFRAQGFPMLVDSPTNQIFPILPNKLVAALHQNYEFLDWQTVDNQHTAIRFITSWATPEEAVDECIEDLSRLV